MHWDNGWYDGMGGWGWFFMAVLMLAFWGGVVWMVTSGLRHGFKPSSAASTPAPEDILNDRFARGEIEVEEYHHRLDVIRAKRGN